jgi:hypothetical protein
LQPTCSKSAWGSIKTRSLRTLWQCSGSTAGRQPSSSWPEKRSASDPYPCRRTGRGSDGQTPPEFVH